MAALAAASGVVSAQQEYAKTHDLGSLFESLTVALIVKKPAAGGELLAYLSDELGRVTAAKARGERYVPEGGRGVDTEEGAARYLQEQGVHALLEELLTLALVAKPSDPAAFVAAELAARAAAAPAAFFTDDDLRGIHSLFDPTHNNLISAAQARAALKTIGAAPGGAAEERLEALQGSGARLDADAFVALARGALRREPL